MDPADYGKPFEGPNQFPDEASHLHQALCNAKFDAADRPAIGGAMPLSKRSRPCKCNACREPNAATDSLACKHLASHGH